MPAWQGRQSFPDTSLKKPDAHAAHVVAPVLPSVDWPFKHFEQVTVLVATVKVFKGHVVQLRLPASELCVLAGQDTHSVPQKLPTVP